MVYLANTLNGQVANKIQPCTRDLLAVPCDTLTSWGRKIKQFDLYKAIVIEQEALIAANTELYQFKTDSIARANKKQLKKQIRRKSQNLLIAASIAVYAILKK